MPSDPTYPKASQSLDRSGRVNSGIIIDYQRPGHEIDKAINSAYKVLRQRDPNFNAAICQNGSQFMGQARFVNDLNADVMNRAEEVLALLLGATNTSKMMMTIGY